MRKTLVYCDNCGSQEGPTRGIMFVNALRGPIRDDDLCPRCFPLLRTLLSIPEGYTVLGIRVDLAPERPGLP